MNVTGLSRPGQPSRNPSVRPWRSAAWALSFAAVIAAAAWARLARFRGVFPEGSIAMLDGDSAYHLHRILETVRNFPHVPFRDPWMNWPDGGICPWAVGFDLAGAAWVLLLGGRGDLERTKLLIALFPVVLGILVVWSTMALARRVVDGDTFAPFVALTAGILGAVIPQGVSSSLFGRSDHHVAEALFMVLLALWCLRSIAPARPWPGSQREAWLWETEGALLIAGALVVFTGAVIYVAIAGAPLLIRAVLRREPAPFAGSGTPAFWMGAFLASLGSVGAVQDHGQRLSFLRPSFLQPLLVAVGGGLLFVAWAASRSSEGLQRRHSARLTLLAATSLVAVLGLAAMEPVRSGLYDWLLRRDPWIASISEFQPLWRAPGDPGLFGGLYYYFGSLGPAALLTLPLGVFVAIRRHLSSGVAFGSFVVTLAALTTLQGRFGRVLLPFLAVASALALQALATTVIRWMRGGVLHGEAIVLIAATTWVGADPRLRRQLLETPSHAAPALLAAALDLRDAPAVSRGAASGVLAPWDFGHDLESLGGRPVVVNGFGSYLDAKAFREIAEAYRLSPDELTALMERRDLGYLVAGSFTQGTLPFKTSPAGGVLNPDILRAQSLGPLAIGGSGIPGSRVRHLAGFLPRFASEATVSGLAFPLPVLWVYEHVVGARLRGRAPLRALVVAELPFRENRRPHVWKAWTEADAYGYWELVVPVPSGFVRPTLWTEAAWSVGAGGPPIAVSVPEAAVRQGFIIEVGLVPGPPTGASKMP